MFPDQCCRRFYEMRSCARSKFNIPIRPAKKKNDDHSREVPLDLPVLVAVVDDEELATEVLIRFGLMGAPQVLSVSYRAEANDLPNEQPPVQSVRTWPRLAGSIEVVALG